MTDVQLALTTDTQYLPQTMVAMLSVLRQARRPVRVHILGDRLSVAAKKVIEEGCRRNGGADLVFHDLEGILPRQHLLGNWPRAILGRLYIPGMIDGRVLYLDGDTYTFADISPLFGMDMGGNLLGAVRDIGQISYFEKQKKLAQKPEAFKYAENIMSPFPRNNCFNSGVLLFDCDGIRKNDEILSHITRIEKLENYSYPDQDHLNIVFKNRTLLLHPSWNSSYGLERHSMRLCKRVLPPEEVHKLKKPKIIHYVLGPKPFHAFEVKWLLKTSVMIKRFPRFIEYRRNAKRLLAPYGAAIDKAVLASRHAPMRGKKLKGGVARSNIQIMLCADMASLRRAWIAMGSVIKCASAPVTVHLLGDGLGGGDVERLTVACRNLADARLVHHDVTCMLAAARSKAFEPRTITGRMLLSQLVEGRVLCIDSDTLTCGDIRPLFEIDMGTAKVAAVRDYAILEAFRKSHSHGEEKFGAQIDLMHPLSTFMYFDSSVILMDCTAIKRDADIPAASEWRLPEQDLLNSIFKNQVHYLDHSWNCMWGQNGRLAQIAREFLPECPDKYKIPPKIIHFTGTRKPWGRLGSWCLSMSGAKKLPAIHRYRMAERQLSKFLCEDVADLTGQFERFPNSPEGGVI